MDTRRRYLSWCWLVALVASPATLASCAPKSCGQSCGTTLEIKFAAAANPWKAGLYTVDVMADNESGACSVMLPLMCGRAAACSGARSWTVADTGCMETPDKHGLIGVTFMAKSPNRISVVVARADEILAEQTFMPAWDSDDCSPPCRTAESVTMRLP